MRRFLSLPAAVAAAVTAFAAVVVTGDAAGARPAERALPGSVPVWASPAVGRGDAPDGERVVFRVYLRWRDPGGAARLATLVSTPGAGSYGRYLSTGRFRERFSPTRRDVDAVRGWLRRVGLRPGYVPGSRHYVSATGSVARVEDACGTRLGRFAYGGRVLRSLLRVPAGLPVAAVVGVVTDPTNGHTYTAITLGHDRDLTIHTRPGYDNVTGLGTPNGHAFLTAINHAT